MCQIVLFKQIWMHAIAKVMVEKVVMYSPIDHTRSMPCGGMCILVPRVSNKENANSSSSSSSSSNNTDKSKSKSALSTTQVLLQMLRLLFVEASENVTRSLTQLVLGTYMLWDAKKARLAVRFFDGEDIQ